MLIRRIIGRGRIVSRIVGLSDMFYKRSCFRLAKQQTKDLSHKLAALICLQLRPQTAILQRFFRYIFFILLLLLPFLPQFPWSLRKTLVAVPLFPAWVCVCVCVCNFQLVNGSVNAHLACEVSTKTSVGILMSVKAECKRHRQVNGECHKKIQD